MLCYLYDAPTYLIFGPASAELPDLLYYSHIPSAIIALLVGFFVFFSGRKLLLNQLLLVLSLCFSAWVILSLMVWAGNDATLFAFIWPFYGILAAFLAIFSVYFTYVFVHKHDAPAKLKGLFLILLLPVLLFSHTNLGVSGFNISYCDAFMFEGEIVKFYYNALGFVAMIWILGLIIPAYRKATKEMKKQLLLLGIGIELFLFLFISIIFIVTQLTALGYFEDSRLEFYGLFGMTFFMAILGVLIVRFKTFKANIAAPIALIVALLLVTASQFAYIESRAGFGVTTTTLVLGSIVAVMLIHSVRRELKQKAQLEELTKELAMANERLKGLDKLKSEFVSIASHQLRSPITSIRGYASMLIDGSFGQIPKKAQEPLERIEKSSQLMAASIEDYLNVSRIESGNMKYNYTDFNLKDEVEHIVDDMRPDAVKKGLAMIFRTDMKSRGVVHADLGKSVQIVQNLITNSIKYTPEGTIKVLVRDDMVKKKLCVDIVDTGIGMSEKTIAKLFGKFERADNAHTVNTSGTGLGLFVAFKMAEAMGGTITAHSEGDGKGSRFTFEMPLAM